MAQVGFELATSTFRTRTSTLEDIATSTLEDIAAAACGYDVNCAQLEAHIRS